VVLVVVMGVAGVGKTTVGRLVAAELELPFHDADDFHPKENRRKMAAGIPLSERDRKPWLRELARRIPEWEAAGGAVLACSALRAGHRRILRAASSDAVFVFLEASLETFRARLRNRPGHYMPPSLLESQLATLEPPAADEAIRIRAEGAPAQVARAVVTALSARA
jgi:carbohydrate kinase (thermoresistant glucokinase family)